MSGKDIKVFKTLMEAEERYKKLLKEHEILVSENKELREELRSLNSNWFNGGGV